MIRHSLPWRSIPATRVAALLLVAAAFFLTRAVAWRQFSQTVYYTHPLLDALHYDELARHIADGHWQQDRAFFFGPGYSYILGIAYKVFGAAPWVGRFVNLASSLMILVLSGWIGFRLAGMAGGIASSALWALYRPALFYEQTLLMEVLAGALGMAVLAGAVGWFVPRKPAASLRSTGGMLGGGAVCGLLLGVAALARANILLFAPFFAGWVAWRIRTIESSPQDGEEEVEAKSGTSDPAVGAGRSVSKKHRRRDKAKHRRTIASRSRGPVARGGLESFRDPVASAALLVLGVLFGVLPATVHNLRAEGDFVLITSNAGVNLYIGNNSRSRGYFVVPEGLNTEYDPRGERLAERALGRTDVSSAEVSGWWKERALDWIRANPGGFLLNTARKILLLVTADEIPQIYHQDVMAEDLPFLRWPLVTFAVLAPLAAIGFVAALRRSDGTGELNPGRGAVAGLLGLFVLAQGLSLLPFFVTGRYRIPFVPALCVLGGAGIVAMWESLIVFLRTRSGLRKHPQAGPGSIQGSRRALIAWVALGVGVLAVSLLAETGRRLPPREVSQFESMHAMLLIRAGRTGEALELLERRAQEEPTAGVWSALGSLYEKQPGRMEAAAEAYEKAAALSPEDARVWFNLSQALLRLGRHEEAREALERALALDPDVQPLAWYNLAMLYTMQGRNDEARVALKNYLARQPGDPEARELLRKLESEPQASPR